MSHSSSIEKTDLSPSESLSAPVLAHDAGDLDSAAPPAKQPKTKRFWAVFVALMFTVFLSALDLTALSTALPIIAQDLQITEGFSWVGSSYALSSTAFIPWFSATAMIFGRRSMLLAAITFFAAGSIICALAQSFGLFVAGRTIQGIGGGGILSLSEMLVCDLVPQVERGQFYGLLGAVWALASAIGPVLGGAFADLNWRGLFWINIPLSLIAFILVAVFMTFRVPTTTFREKMGKIDWLGQIVFIGSVTSTVLALTWAGQTYPWSSPQVLAPLVIGLAGLVAWGFIEAKWEVEPTLPKQLFQNRSAVSGLVAVFLHGIAVIALTYYAPVIPQAIRGSSATSSGIQLFGVCFTIAPAAIITGITIQITRKYQVLNFIGWSIAILGCGLLSTMDATTSIARFIGFQIIVGIGLGVLYAAPQFPLMASIPVELHATAMATVAFVRSFGQIFGITIGETLLTSRLDKDLPDAFAEQLGGQSSAYAAIPRIAAIGEPLRSEVRVAFADAVKLIFQFAIGLAGLGLLVALVAKELPMHELKDERYALKDGKAEPVEVVEHKV